MEWLVYILLGVVVIQQIQIIFLNLSNKNFGEFMQSQNRMNNLLLERINLYFDQIMYCLGIRVDNTASNEEGNGSINPSEADTGLCHEVSRQK